MIEPLFMRFIVDRVLLNKALDAAARIARLNATGALCSRAKKCSADAADRGNRPSCALRPAPDCPRLAGMANEQAIHSVGATLRSYLESTYPPHLRTSYPCEFHLASSNEVAKLDTLSTRSGATLLLYLYHITVSGESQNAALPTGVGSQSRQALSVDLHYLLNVVAPLAVTENVVLAFAMRQLALRPVLDGASMAEWGWRPDESVQLIPETVPLNDFANVFSAMSQHYRTSALYVARGVQIDLDPGGRSTSCASTAANGQTSMTEIVAPGVYVAETPSNARSIAAVPTTTAGFIGRTRRGPVYGITDTALPRALTSVADFERTYGGFHAIGAVPNYLALAVRAFFDNGGTKLYVSRVAELPDAATEALTPVVSTVYMSGPDVGGKTDRATSALVIASADPSKAMDFAARFSGEAGNATIVVTQVATPLNQATIDAAPVGSLLRLVGVPPVLAKPLLGAPAAAAPAATAARSTSMPIAKTTTTSVTSSMASSVPTKTAKPVAGVVATPIAHVSVAQASIASSVADTSYYLKTADGLRDANGALLAASALMSILANPNGAALLTITVAASDADGRASVVDAGLGFDARHPRWLGAVLAPQPPDTNDAATNFVEARIGRSLDAFALRAGLFGASDSLTISLQGGSDGPTPSVDAFRRALSAFEQITDIAAVAAPDAAASPSTLADVNAALIAHAERANSYRLAVLDTAAGLTASQAVAAKGAIDSSSAAIYYPWIVVANPLATPAAQSIPADLAIPPSGALCGIFARNDLTRGVANAPANVAVQGALRFERDVTDAEQDALNTAGINTLRSFAGKGLLVWGARTTSSDAEWKYVSVRRYFNYIEQSIDQGTRWTVFEPNAAPLWASVRSAIANFLTTEFRNGALQGTKPEQAFFVKCDASTMTQNDLDNGRLVCLVGIAPVKAAEFVIIRIGQWTSTSTNVSAFAQAPTGN